MSIDTVAAPAAEPDDPPAVDPPMRRRWPWVALAVIIVLGVAAASVVPRLDGAGGSADPDATVATPATGVAAVERRDVSAQQQAGGTLGFAGAFHAIGQKQGTITAIPAVGSVLRPGDVLYRVDGAPVILLDGATPAWRDFEWGATGPDVTQLNAALVALGHADGLDLDPTSDKVAWATQQAVRNLQGAYGVTKTGILAFGDVVFLPGAVRVTAVSAPLGTAVGPGQAIIEATSTTPQVKADIPVTLAQRVKVGDAVTISMPDLSVAEGTVQSVGTVATQVQGQTATIPVQIALTDPEVAAGLDQAPVLVSITTATVEDALVVPVTALMALAGGKYAVEVHEPGGNRLVEVELGLFDSAGGVVEVTASGLESGQQVVVPST